MMSCPYAQTIMHSWAIIFLFSFLKNLFQSSYISIKLRLLSTDVTKVGYALELHSDSSDEYWLTGVAFFKWFYKILPYGIPVDFFKLDEKPLKFHDFPKE